MIDGVLAVAGKSRNEQNSPRRQSGPQNGIETCVGVFTQQPSMIPVPVPL